MQTIHIPSSVDEATQRLTGVESLLTAYRWERAAIVAAFVRLGEQGVSPTKANGGLSTDEFAALGIAGLKSKTTVQTYVKRWLEYSEGIYPQPGADVLIPSVEWEPTRTGTNGGNSVEGMRATIQDLTEKHGVEGVANAIMDTGNLGSVVTEKTRDQLHAKLTAATDRDEQIKSRSPFNELRFEVGIDKANRIIQECIALVRNGEFNAEQRGRMLYELEGHVSYVNLLKEAIQGVSIDEQLADLLDRDAT